MAIPTTTIEGKFLLPSGVGANGGKITARLSQNGTVEDDVTFEDHAVGGETVGSIGTDGTISLVLIPNDEITPGGTYYLVTFELADGIRIREQWEVASAPDPVDVGAVTRVDAPVATPAFGPPLVDVLPAASSIYRGRFRTVRGDANEEDVTYQCLKGFDDVYRWIPAILGGGA